MNKRFLQIIGLKRCAQDRKVACESSIPAGSIFYNSKFLKKVSFMRKDKQTNRQTDRQTDGQTDRQTDKQTDKHPQPCSENKPFGEPSVASRQ